MSLPRIIYFVVLLSVVLFSAACERQNQNAPDIIILQTGRIRGNVYPLDLQDIAPLQHYPYLAAYIKKVRAEAKEVGAQVLLIDTGDSLEGSFAGFATGDRNMVTFFNSLDYDVVALGNLDHAIPSEILSELKASVITPFTDFEGKPVPAGARLAASIEKGDIPIKVLANFYGDTRPEDFPTRFPVFFGKNATPSQPLRDYQSLEILAEKNKNELRLLSWMKFESPNEPPADFLSQLRAAQIDAILAHRIYPGKQVDAWNSQSNTELQNWSPPVTQNILRSNAGFAIARTDLKQVNNKWKFLNTQVLPMTANTAEADQEIIEKINTYKSEIAEANALIGILPSPMEPHEILKIYLQALTSIPNTNVVACSQNSIRTDWPKGNLYSSTVFNSFPWTTPLVQLKLTPQELQKLLHKFPEITFWERKEPATDETSNITLTSSNFYASLFLRTLGLPHDRLHILKEQPEFEFFAKFLTAALKQPDFGVPKNILTGWKDLNHQDGSKQ
ncbi:MAG: hypothetical protein ACK5NG_05700 [Chthoniobacterales bacterium]